MSQVGHGAAVRGDRGLRCAGPAERLRPPELRTARLFLAFMRCRLAHAAEASPNFCARPPQPADRRSRRADQLRGFEQDFVDYSFNQRRSGLQLADRYDGVDPVAGRRERARPRGVVGAGRCVGEVEVDHEATAVAAQVCALDRVEHVAAAAVPATGLAAATVVDAAGTVRRRRTSAATRRAHRCRTARRRRAVRTAPRRRCRSPPPRAPARRAEPRRRTATPRRTARHQARRSRLAAPPAPASPGGGRTGRPSPGAIGRVRSRARARPDRGVEREHPAPPVDNVESVHAHEPTPDAATGLATPSGGAVRRGGLPFAFWLRTVPGGDGGVGTRPPHSSGRALLERRRERECRDSNGSIQVPGSPSATSSSRTRRRGPYANAALRLPADRAPADRLTAGADVGHRPRPAGRGDRRAHLEEHALQDQAPSARDSHHDS